MIDIDEMQGFHGGIDPIINFPETLSASGAAYFTQGLTAWKTCVTHSLNVKQDSLRRDNQDIEQVLRDEGDAFYEGELTDDDVLGPISLLQSCYHLKYANIALKYMAHNKNISDVALYEEMIDSAYFADISVIFPEYAEEENPHRQLKRILHFCDNEQIAIDFECSNDSICQVMRQFRTAQCDLFSPVEKKLFMHGLNYYMTPYPLPFDTYMERDFTASAINNSTAKQRSYDINRAYDMDIYDLVPEQGRYFLALHHQFRQMAAHPDNAYHFNMAQCIHHAFNVFQAYCHDSLLQAVTFEEFMNRRADGRHQSTVYPQEYKTYHAAFHEQARVPLLSPEGMKNHCEVYLSYDNFTDTQYHEKMNPDGRNSFNMMLQSKLDAIVKETGLNSVNVIEFRKQIAQFDYPRI